MTSPHSLDGYLVAGSAAPSPNFLGVVGKPKPEYKDVAVALRELNADGNFSVFHNSLHRIVTSDVVEEQFLAEHGLYIVNEQVDEGSFHYLLKRRIVSDFPLHDFKQYDGGIRKILPIKSSVTIDQFLHYKLSFSTINGRTMFRPDPVTRYAAKRHLHELSDSELNAWLGKEVSVEGRKDSFRIVRAIPQSEVPQLPGGESILSLWSGVNQRIHSALESEPDMRCAEVQSGDYYGRGSGARSDYAPLCALKQIIRLEDIQHDEIGLFMPQSHVALGERFARSQQFVEILSVPYVSPFLVTSNQIGYEEIEFNSSRVVMGGGETVNSIDPVGLWRALLNGPGIFREPESLRIGLVPLVQDSPHWMRYLSLVEKDLRGLKLSPMFVPCKPVFEDGELPTRFELQKRFEDMKAQSDLDTLFVEFPMHSDSQWRAVKQAGRGASLQSQIITQPKMRIGATSFNVALGLIAASGGMPLGLNSSVSGIDVWIGIDVGSDGTKHIAAASVAFDANGTLIGHVNTVPIAGERIENKAYETMIKDILEGLEFHGVISSKKTINIGILRDGFFNESLVLLDQFESMYNVRFTAISFLKRNQARIADWNGNEFVPASAGLSLISHSSKSALIQTNEQRSGELSGSPTIKRLKIERGNVDLSQLVEDVFWLCKINAASTQQPGVPIPIHYAHKLAEQAVKGLGVSNGFHTDLGFL